ncbi:MAG: hypothetical protein IH947_10115, partial [Bacteroidetes bacterium]|nr:hypothetical protein [Bacteroidota bacterium]
GTPAEDGDIGTDVDDGVQEILLKLPPELQDLYQTMADYVQTLVEQGKQINPNIEITDEQMAEFVEQAKKEFEPFFTGEQKSILLDLQRSLGRAISVQEEQEVEAQKQFEEQQIQVRQQGEDRQKELESIMRAQGRSEEDINAALGQLQVQQQRTEEDLARRFGQDIRRVGEFAADRGISSSGERLRVEGELEEGRDRSLSRSREDLAFQVSRGETGIARGIEDVGFAQERAGVLTERATGALGRNQELVRFSPSF